MRMVVVPMPHKPVIKIPVGPKTPIITTTTQIPQLTISATSGRDGRHTPPSSAHRKTNQQQQTQKQEQRQELSQHEKQIPISSSSGTRTKKPLSGIDVLWAMQRAANEKKRTSGGGGGNRKNKKGLHIERETREDSVGYEHQSVRPLKVKSEWSIRLQELETRLEQMSNHQKGMKAN